jgi:hypothetical protein
MSLDGYGGCSTILSIPLSVVVITYSKYSYKEKRRRPPSKKNVRGKTPSPRNRKACHSTSTALLQRHRIDRNPKYQEEQ